MQDPFVLEIFFQRMQYVLFYCICIALKIFSIPAVNVWIFVRTLNEAGPWKSSESYA